MIEGPAAPVGIHFTQEAIRQSLQHERNLAAVALPEQEKEADFEGKGPQDPVRGTIVDLSV